MPCLDMSWIVAREPELIFSTICGSKPGPSNCWLPLLSGRFPRPMLPPGGQSLPSAPAMPATAAATTTMTTTAASAVMNNSNNNGVNNINSNVGNNNGKVIISTAPAPLVVSNSSQIPVDQESFFSKNERSFEIFFSFLEIKT